MLFNRRILLRFGSVSSYPGFPPKIMCPFAIHYCCNMCHPIPYFYRRSTPLLQPKSQKNKRKNMKMWFWDIVKRCTGFIFSCITALTKHSTFRVCILMLLVHVILRKSTYEKLKKNQINGSMLCAEFTLLWGSKVESRAIMWEWGQTILCDVSWCKYLVCYNSYNFTSFQLVNKKSLWNV